MSCKRSILASAILVGCAAATVASAVPRWPGNVVGTWKGISNQSPIVLTVSSQAAGTNLCDTIMGTIEDVNGGFTGNMIGFYCPSSGAVEFMRYPSGSNVPYQVYSGNLSQANHPQAALMAGSFGQYSTAYGPLGQYAFSLKN